MPIDERSKAMYQPWNQDGFNADLRVRRMTPVQRWIYKSLLQEAFVCTTRPRLPDNDEELWIMADCETYEQWMENKATIIRMFEMIEEDGEPLLLHRRLEEDWNRILDIREAKSDAGKKSGETRRQRREAKKRGTDVEHNRTEPNTCSTEVNTTEQMLNKPEENPTSKLSNESNEINISNESEEAIPEYEQGEEMKADKQIPISCQQILHVKAETYPDVINQIKASALSTSNGQILREFEEWAVDNQGDDFRGKPLTAFLRSRESLHSASAKAASDPLVTNLARELAYRSDSLVTFDNRQKVGLRKVLDEGFEPEEIVSVFRVFFQNLDTTKTDDVKYAAQNFVQKAADLAAVARRKQAEKELEASAVDSAKERMQRVAEEDRIARQRARDAEDSLVEDELGD